MEWKGDAVRKTQIKVRVHIPAKAACRQQKINRIYDILKPENALESQAKMRYNNCNVLSANTESGGRK